MAEPVQPTAPSGAYLVAPSGEAMRVPFAQAQDLLSAGWQPATPEQAEQVKAKKAYQEKYGNPLSQIGGGLEAMARGATLSLSDVAERAMGVPAEDIAGRKDVLGGTATGLEVLGAVAPAFLTGGSSAPESGALTLGRAAEALPAALVPKLGGAVTRGIESLLPEAQSLGGKLLTKAVSHGVAGGLEGGVWGFGQVVHEAALGDPNLTAQSAMDHIGMNALLGGGLGAGIGLGSAALPEIVGKTKDVIRGAFKQGEESLKKAYTAGEAVTGTAPETASLMLEHRLELESLSNQIPGLTDTISNATPEMAQWTLKNGSRLAEMEKAFPGTTAQLARASPETADYLLNNWQNIITDPVERVKVASTLTNDMQRVVDHTNSLLKKINQDLAPKEAAALLEGETGEQMGLAYAKVTDNIHKASLQMRAEPELFAPGYAKHLEQLRDGLIRDVEGSVKPLEAFQRLRTLRQSLDEAIPYGKDLGSLGISERNGIKALKDLRAQVKDVLTDESVFGKAAARMSALDAAQSEWLSLMKRGGEFNTKFMQKLSGPGGVSYQLKPTKLNTWLNQMVDARGKDFSETWGRAMDAAKKIADEAELSYKSAPTGKFSRTAIDSLLEKAGVSTEQATSRAAVTQVKNQLDPRMSWGSMPVATSQSELMAQSLLGKAADKVLPRAITSSIKAVAEVGKSVPRGLAVLSALEKAGQAVSKRIDKGVSALVKGSKLATAGAAKAATSAAEIGHQIEHISKLAQAPGAFVDAVTQNTGSLHEHAPETSTAMMTTAGRAVSFLASKLPQTPPKNPLTPEPKLTEQQRWEWSRYYNAVNQPTSILEHAAKGTLTPQDVEAVSQTSPALYEKIRKEALSQLAEHKGALSYSRRMMLGMLLGQDVDGTLTPQAIQTNQLIFQLPSAKSGQDQTGPQAAVKTGQTGLSKLKVANHSLLPGQSSEMRRGEL